MLSLLQRLIFGPARTFKPPIPMMAECRRCERIIRICAANRLTAHLIHDHNMPDHEAYDTVDWVFKRLIEHMRLR